MILNFDFEEEDFELSVSWKIVYYLAEVDNEAFWDIRGMKGHGGGMARQHALMESLDDKYQQRIEESDELRDKVQEFAEKAYGVMLKLEDHPEEILHSLLGDRKIFMITGFYRSGGTYLAKSLMEAQNQNVRSYAKGMIHDGSIPIKPVVDSWDDPKSKRQTLYFIAQWLLWCSKEFGEDCNYIVKKSTSFGPMLKYLPEIFGDWAEVILHVRHPYPSMISYSELTSGEEEDTSVFTESSARLDHWFDAYGKVYPNITQDEWDRMSYYENFLMTWLSYHYKMIYPALGKLLESGCNIHPLTFGTEYEDFVAQFYEQMNSSLEPEAFVPKERSIPEEFFNHPLHDELEEFREDWVRRGLKWPEHNK